ncbi:MAG TPA: hypothetical protein VK797_22990 [Tepidisphaeraceae bacterium]|jgi:hypothetical protein|nr:hypothetical protein [Tepidisphaeraceae bacterium]
MDFRTGESSLKYVPEKHEGTAAERIRGLAGEAKDICQSGFMRLHAKDRELNRIQSELKALGAEMLEGAHEDEGFFLVVERHLEGCQVGRDGECRCPPIARFESCY